MEYRTCLKSDYARARKAVLESFRYRTDPGSYYGGSTGWTTTGSFRANPRSVVLASDQRAFDAQPPPPDRRWYQRRPAPAVGPITRTLSEKTVWTYLECQRLINEGLEVAVGSDLTYLLDVREDVEAFALKAVDMVDKYGERGDCNFHELMLDRVIRLTVTVEQVKRGCSDLAEV